MANFTDTRLLTEQFFRDNSGIGDTNDIEPYRLPMFLAEEIELQQIVGNDQFDRLVAWAQLNSASQQLDANNVANQELVDRASLFLVFHILYLSKLDGGIDITDSGRSVYSGGDNGITPTDDQNNQDLLVTYQYAKTFRERFIKWVRDNRDTYPLIGASDSDEVESDLSNDSTFPITNL